MKFWIADFQGFQYGQRDFICREINLLNVQSGESLHTLVRIPFDCHLYNIPMRKQITWLTDNHHGLQWNDKLNNNNNNMSTIKYESISEFLKKYLCYDNDVTAIVLVKGSEKKKWLLQFIDNTVVDLSEENCLPLKTLKNIFKSHHCGGHYDNSLSCSLENAHFLYFWYLYCKRE